ncbi:MAG: hypothetical protein VW378_00330 [bacterium]
MTTNNHLNPLKKITSYIAIHTGLGLMYLLIKTISYKQSMLLGKGLGKLLALLIKKRLQIAFHNIKKCYPNKTNQQQLDATHKHFESLGKGIIEVFISCFYSKKRLNAITKLEGLENIDSTKGAILITGHFTQIEVASRIISLKTNKDKTAALYMPITNKIIERFIFRQRKKYFTPISLHNPKQAINHLRKKKILHIVPDQNISGITRKETITFFNNKLKALSTCSDFAKLGNALIYPCEYHINNQTYIFKINKPLKNLPTKDKQKDTQLIFDTIEKSIKKRPENYFWVHQLFKDKT